jgi:hypothetical protein
MANYNNISIVRLLLLLVTNFLLINSIMSQDELRFARWSSTNGFFGYENIMCEDIISDHGMRVADPPATLFHRGSDVAPLNDENLVEQNVVLVAHRLGRIRQINIGNGSIIRRIYIDFGTGDPYLTPSTWVKDHSLVVLHIFADNSISQTRNGFRITTLADVGGIGSSPVIIDLVNNRAYSSSINKTIVYNNIAMVTTDMVAQGAPFAPIGTSGGYPYHAHISLLENNSFEDGSCYESVEPINHEVTVGETIANIRLQLRNRDKTHVVRPGNTSCEENPDYGQWQSFQPTYNDETRNIVEAELHMLDATRVTGTTNRYENSYMNDEEVFVELKNRTCGSNWSVIRGRHSEARIISNASNAKLLTPARICHGAYGGLAANNIGIIPYAYTSGIRFHPHDYYIYPDFYHRIHKDHDYGAAVRLAQYPWDTRYKDGKYAMKGTLS